MYSGTLSCGHPVVKLICMVTSLLKPLYKGPVKSSVSLWVYSYCFTTHVVFPTGVKGLKNSLNMATLLIWADFCGLLITRFLGLHCTWYDYFVDSKYISFLVLKCKRAYYQACKARDQAEKLHKDACVEGSTVTEDQVRKLKDKSERAASDAQTTKGKYQESLRDIGNYNPKYMEDMRFVFNKCQQSEEERKNFFKQTFLNFCQQMSLAPHFNRYMYNVVKLFAKQIIERAHADMLTLYNLVCAVRSLWQNNHAWQVIGYMEVVSWFLFQEKDFNCNWATCTTELHVCIHVLLILAKCSQALYQRDNCFTFHTLPYELFIWAGPKVHVGHPLFKFWPRQTSNSSRIK